MEGDIKRGCRVVVSFGKKKIYTAIVARVHDERPDYADIKPVSELLDRTPVVTEQQFSFWQWIASYYVCSVGEVYKAYPKRSNVPTTRLTSRSRHRRPYSSTE